MSPDPSRKGSEERSVGGLGRVVEKVFFSHIGRLACWYWWCACDTRNSCRAEERYCFHAEPGRVESRKEPGPLVISQMCWVSPETVSGPYVVWDTQPFMV